LPRVWPEPTTLSSPSAGPGSGTRLESRPAIPLSGPIFCGPTRQRWQTFSVRSQPIRCRWPARSTPVTPK
jgi:hypothetical protein